MSNVMRSFSSAIVEEEVQAVSIFTRESMTAVTHIDEHGVAKMLGVVKDFRAAKGLGSFIPENARLAISWVRLAKNEKLDVHTHPIASLYIVSEGEGVLLGGDTDKVLKAGDVICIPPGCDHGFIGAGDSGYWGLSIQFAERGLYEDPSRPLVTFNDPYALYDQLIADNERYAEKFADNSIFDVLLKDELDPAVRSKFLDYLQILSDQFQKMVLLRSGICDDASFNGEFDDHLKEEFGHHHLLRNSRTDLVSRTDAPFEALCIWFNHQMLVLDNIEKLVLVHLVVEASAHVFYSKIKKVFDSSKLTHFDEHSDHDHDHQGVNRKFFKNMTTAQFSRIQEIQRQGWSVVEKQYQRLSEIIVE